MIRLGCRRLAFLCAAGVLLSVTGTAAATPTITGGIPDGGETNNPVVPQFTIKGTGLITWAFEDGSANWNVINAGLGSPTTSFTLPKEGVYRLRASDATLPYAFVYFTFDQTPPPAPTITSGPASPTGVSKPLAFSWTSTLDATGAAWRLLEGGVTIQEGQVSGTSTTLTPTLAPGDHILQFRVALRDAAGNQGNFSPPYTFLVDQTGPPAPVGVTGPAGTTRSLTPSFTWQPAEGGGSFEWNVTDAAGASILAPTVSRITSGTSITTPALPLAPGLVHRLTFTVRQIDGSGNRGPLSAPFAFTITTVTTTRPPTRLAKYMHPAVGRVTTLRPVLSWRRTRPGTAIFNVQIWDGNRKIMTKWPKGTHLRVPAGTLKRGKRYSWYVWSWIGKQHKFYKLPLTSWFRTKR